MERDKFFEYYLTEHDEEVVIKMLEQEKQLSEKERRWNALNPTVKAYLNLTGSLAAADLPRPARGILAYEQQRHLSVITGDPKLQTELANYLSFQNAELEKQRKQNGNR